MMVVMVCLSPSPCSLLSSNSTGRRGPNTIGRRFASVALALALIASSRATVETFVSPGTVLTDVREYAGTGFGNETRHSVRLDLRVYGVSNDFQYVIPTYPQGYSVSNVRKAASKQFSIDGTYIDSLTSNGQTVPSPTISIQGTTNFEYRFPGVASRTVTETWGYGITWDVTDPQGNVSHVSDSSAFTYSTVLALGRQDVDMVSLDSRRVYGQPNLDGELSADPNADLRNVSFAGWTFKGGMFVGAATGGDLSGTARIQAWMPTVTGALMSSLTLRALGQPRGYAMPTLQAFSPSATDPNLAATSTTLTWANRWDLSASSPVGDATPVGSLPPNEYFRIKMLQVPSLLGIALTDEGAGSGAWQYFASSAYEAAYPLADSRPRLWTVTGTTTPGGHLWQYWNGTTGAGGGTPPGGGGATGPTDPTGPTGPTNPTGPEPVFNVDAASARAAKRPAPKPAPTERPAARPVKAKKRVSKKGAR